MRGSFFQNLFLLFGFALSFRLNRFALRLFSFLGPFGFFRKNRVALFNGLGHSSGSGWFFLLGLSEELLSLGNSICHG